MNKNVIYNFWYVNNKILVFGIFCRNLRGMVLVEKNIIGDWVW